MINRDIYLKDPATQKLVNNGVARVDDSERRVLRYELETFVCDGQYEKGMAHIIETYLSNIGEAQQPAVWVSGFFGSGKSHLVKMLHALWEDTSFDDGATARSIANLPQSISDSLKELSVQARRQGGLHAASGTLGASASNSIRLALLAVIFKSAGLPQNYPVARFVMWLKSEGIYKQVRDLVEQNGSEWDEELANFHVAEDLYQVLCDIKPKIFSSDRSASEVLENLYPNVSDISNDEMLRAIKQALSVDGEFPLTLIVLDEIQQFIGGNSQRSIEVQEIVETCCKNFGGKLLLVGTGQTAVTGTTNLKKLEGRFTVRVELSDADVDAVIRKVLLSKKPEAIPSITKMMETNSGEISRHLTNTSIGHRQSDMAHFSQDYPILPVRRRFWENALRVLDSTGTDSQLRNQLNMIHAAIQTNMNKPLGHVISADYLYFDAADKLQQTSVLPRRVYQETMCWHEGTDDERLMASACGLVFLINKLGSNREIGIRATVDTIADLMVEDLANGSGALRSKLPGLLDDCKLLMKVNDEYRIQTEESAAWLNEFQNQRANLANETHRIDNERDDRIRGKFGKMVSKLSLQQGVSKVTREISPTFDGQGPNDADGRICVWVRDGWSIDENSVRADARAAGNQSPTVFVFIPRRSSDDLRRQLIDFKAASTTIERRGAPSSPEGKEARAAMETTRQNAESRINELLDDAFSGAHVFQGGGNEISGDDLQNMIIEAAGNSLKRLYPQFSIADHAGWTKVYDKAKAGAPDALKAVGDNGEPAQNHVCKAIHASIAAGKKGADIRTYFESPPYGWGRDAIDGGLQVLLVAGLIQSQDEKGHAIEAKDLERKTIGKAHFRVEAVTVSVPQRLQIRKLMQNSGLHVQTGEELAAVPGFLEKMMKLADQAGGDAPKPTRPDTSSLEEIKLTAGNEQLIAFYHQREVLAQSFDEWTERAKSIEKRWGNWQTLQRLVGHAPALPAAKEPAAQVQTIKQQRQLLQEPDLITPLIASLTQILRDELNCLQSSYDKQHSEGMAHLNSDHNWLQIEQDQRDRLLSAQNLDDASRPAIGVNTTENILATLDACPIGMLAERVAAMSSRFGKVAHEAAILCEPKAQFIRVPRTTVKTEEDIDAWAEQAKSQLRAALPQGPIVIQ